MRNRLSLPRMCLRPRKTVPSNGVILFGSSILCTSPTSLIPLISTFALPLPTAHTNTKTKTHPFRPLVQTTCATTMAGFDELIERLLYDVALSGSQGEFTYLLRTPENPPASPKSSIRVGNIHFFRAEKTNKKNEAQDMTMIFLTHSQGSMRPDWKVLCELFTTKRTKFS